MSAAMFAALCFTVALLVTTAYFIMGSIPLLVLKHDTPLDARFVRGFFNIYYVAAFVTATATAISFAFAGRPGLAAGAAALAVIAVALRRKIIPKMTRSERRSSPTTWMQFRDFAELTSPRFGSTSPSSWLSCGASPP